MFVKEYYFSSLCVEYRIPYEEYNLYNEPFHNITPNSGDILITGNRKEVQIIRKFPHGFETYSIDLTDSNAVNSPYFYIQPNDYIIVKPLKQKTWGTGVTGVQSVATIMTAISLITTLLVLSKTL